MAAWSVTQYYPRTGQHDVMGTHFCCIQQVYVPETPPGHLAFRRVAWAENDTHCTNPANVTSRHLEPDNVLWLYMRNPARVNDSGSRRLVRSEGSATEETVTRLCQQRKRMQAVEALGVLVDTDCPVSHTRFYSVLKECVVKGDLVLGRRVHALTVKKGYESNTLLGNHILRMYASHGRLQEAMDVFTMVAEPDAFMWSSMISALVKRARTKEAIQLYQQMRKSGVKPDAHVFVAGLQACAKGADLKTGQLVHADVVASGVESDLFVGNCLVDMYAKCGSLDDAERVFLGLRQKDVVTWNAMITAYSKQGMGQEALHLFAVMQKEGMTAPDCVTFAGLLHACASLGVSALEKGKEFHALIGERGLRVDVVVGCSLVNMYAKCGSLQDAQHVFDGLGEKDVITWNALIAGYSQQGMGQEALHLYSVMQERGLVAPDSVTFVCLLQACASLGTPALETGKQLHSLIRARGLQFDVVVGCSLVNMYAKCGSLHEAHSVFVRLPQKDVVTWTALIAGYSQMGMGQEALGLYGAMHQEGMAARLSVVTFVCLLQACAGVAALHLGRQLHAQIEEQGLQTDVTVLNSLINMYAKSGSMLDAQQVFDVLPERDIVGWNALIAGYTRQGDSAVVFDLFHRMTQDGIQPDDITFLNVLTVCSHGGLVNAGREYFEAMSYHYCVTPTPEHFSCMTDLLGRAGQVDEALSLVSTMPVKPYDAVWHALLGACRKWNNVEVGRQAFHEALKLDERDAAAYVLMSSIYTSAQMQEEAQEVQGKRMEIGALKQPGQSWWTDMQGLVHTFEAGGTSHPETDVIHAMLKQLLPVLESAGYVPKLATSSMTNHSNPAPTNLQNEL